MVHPVRSINCCSIDIDGPAGRPRFARVRSSIPTVVALLTLSVISAHAAEITYGSGKVNIIAIQGEIAPDDDAKFERIVPDSQKQTGVLLSSPGGNVLAALAIGEMIHKKGYATIVPDGQVCASACGLIWLA